jgi:hypothetical protein
LNKGWYLAGVLIVVGLLVVIVLAVLLVRNSDTGYSADDTPQGVVRNYALALQKKDFIKAYTYLQENENKPGFQSFQETFNAENKKYERASFSFGNTSITGDTASVTIIIQQNSGGPFKEFSRDEQSVELLRQNGSWKIHLFPDPFWGYDWYLEEYK